VFIVVAVFTGLAIGLLRGGRIENLADATFRAWPLLVLGVVVQGLAAYTAAGAVALILASYVILVLFAAANLGHAGMGVVLVGILLNVAVIGANGGMPVREDAIVAAGIVRRDQVRSLDFGSKRHLEGRDDRLTILGDVVPVPLAGEVLSFGDLAMSVGVAAVLANLLVHRRRGSDEPVTPTAPGGSGLPGTG
jgi:hypothetical protein